MFTPSNAASGAGARYDQYQRRESMTVWIGAGLLGLIGLAAGDLASKVMGDVPDLLTALLLTFVVFAGGCLAFARVGFEWAATEIERRYEPDGGGVAAKPARAQLAKADSLPLDLQPWPGFAEAMWRAALLLTLAGAVVYLVAAWWRI